MTFHALAARHPGAALEPFDYEPTPMREDEVEVEIECCGVCHSDVHLVDDDWGVGQYPLVPGHEIVGRVSAIGGVVRGLALGDRVGIGWQRSSCGHCHHCRRGAENLCSNGENTCLGHFGGFADRIRIDARFAFRLPDGLDPERAAPLLCAGATVYAPLRRYVSKPGMRVGVIGVGGLGHLGVQFAAALGAEVSAFSTRPDKADEVRAFGARELLPSRDPDALDAHQDRFDVLLSTVHAKLDWCAFVRTLAPGGVLVLVASSPEPLDVPPGLLLDKQRVLVGSIIAGRRDLADMLELAATRRIGATIERYTFEQANEALARTREGEARYRTVLSRLPAAL